MDNNERDYLRQQIQELTRANRRWKALAIFVTMAFAAFLIAGAVGSDLVSSLSRRGQERTCSPLATQRVDSRRTSPCPGS